MVCSFEVIEHVADPAEFVDSCAALTKDGGAVFLSTMSRTELAYAVAIVAAEQVLKEVPEGTHDWDKFINPAELSAMLRRNGVIAEKTSGMVYDPISKTWSLNPVTVVNYAMYGIKDGPAGL